LDGGEALLEFIKKLKSERRLESYDEAATKQAIILRVLSILGWSPYNVDEVCPEYTVGGKKVDYALRTNGVNKVFIEVKRIGENLEGHQRQLLEYSFSEGVKLAVLTNGITWWLYLPYQEGPWEQRKFYTIEIYDQDAEDITSKFVEFLHKESVITGKAIENAERVYKSRQRERLIRETIPRAWDKLVAEPDERLVELIAETTERLCGYKPDDATIKGFLESHSQKPERHIVPARSSSPPKKHISGHTWRGTEDYTNKRVASFSFDGSTYEVRSWKELLMKICEIMLNRHRRGFEQVFGLRGRKRAYFSRNPEELLEARQIKGTDIYVETNLSANSIVRLSKKIISLFGYPEDALVIEAR